MFILIIASLLPRLTLAEEDSFVIFSKEYEVAQKAVQSAMVAAAVYKINKTQRVLGENVPPAPTTNWSTALSASKVVIQKHPNSYLGYELIALVYEQTGFLDDSITNYQKVTKLKPDDTNAWEHLGEIYKLRGDKKL